MILLLGPINVPRGVCEISSNTVLLLWLALWGGGEGLCKRIKMFFEKRQDTESHLSLSADCFNLKGVEKAIANLIKLEVCHRIGPSNTEVY